MITEDYVSLETAKLLKEKGFDEATNRYYNAQYDQIRTVSDTFMWHWNNEEFMKRVLMEGAIAIPTLQMAMKWLREVHKLCISITPQVTDDDGDGGCLWQFAITSHLEPLSISLELYEQYEEACEVAIRYCLENLI
jgi:hypothetical protein